MKPYKGPSKKLVPALDSEAKCPHEFREEDGLVLEIDCGGCQGSNDLSNRKCLLGVLDAISIGPKPETIVLKRLIHKRYRGEQVRTACAISYELAALKRAISSSDPPSDKKCRTCSARSCSVLDAAKSILLKDPARYITDPASVSAELREGLSNEDCPRGHLCVSDGLSMTSLAQG